MRFIRMLGEAVAGFFLDIISGILEFLGVTVRLSGRGLKVIFLFLFYASLVIVLIILFNYAVRYFEFLDDFRRIAGLAGVALLLFGFLLWGMGKKAHSKDPNRRRREPINLAENLGSRLMVIGFVLGTLIVPVSSGVATGLRYPTQAELDAQRTENPVNTISSQGISGSP